MKWKHIELLNAELKMAFSSTCSVFSSFAVVDGEAVELVDVTLQESNRESC